MTDSSPGRPPLQARSRRTLARIVEAGHALASQRGRDRVTVQEVVSLARVSVGSFYARFAGRDELLRYLDEDRATLERRRWDDELTARLAPDTPLEDRVRAVVGLVLTSAAHASAETHAQLRAVAADALVVSGSLRHPEPRAAVDLAYAATLGAARNPPPEWPPERLTEELVRMWSGYLGGIPARREEPGRGVDFFSVWE